jgi:hypothetical protein
MEEQVLHTAIFVLVSVLVSGFVGFMIAVMLKKVAKMVATGLAVAVLIIIAISYFDVNMGSQAVDLTTGVVNRTSDVISQILTNYADKYSQMNGIGIMTAGLGALVVGFYFGLRSK